MVCRLHGLVEQACFHSNAGRENWVCGWTEGKIPSSPYTVTHVEGKVIKAGLWVLKKGMCVSVCVGYVYAYMFLCVGVGTKVQVHGEARAPMYAIFLIFFRQVLSLKQEIINLSWPGAPASAGQRHTAVIQPSCSQGRRIGILRPVWATQRESTSLRMKNSTVYEILHSDYKRGW